MKYALVTGGSRGIGRAVAIRLSQAGIPVVINYVQNETAATETKAEIEKAGGQAELLRFDVSQPEEIEQAINAWEDAHNLMIFMQNDEWQKVLDTTLNGFFYTTRRLLKRMMTKRDGRIVNISSLSGLKGLPGQVNYSASKSALIGATKALAQEVAPRKITVNAVAPGFVESDMTKDLNESELKRLVPVGRFGKPEEVAALVAFLAGEEAAYITGQVIGINGGMY